MNAPDANKKRQRRICGKGLGAITLYIVTIIALISLLYSFKQGRPQIDEIRISHSSSSLEITGKNLDSNVHATALYHDSLCNNIIAKKFMWERVFDVKVKGSIAWALCRNVGLIALDISTPHQPEIIRTVHINKFLWHLKIKGNTAYIACGKDGVVVCDVSSPAKAKILYEHDLPQYTTDVTSAQNLLYVGNGKHGIRVIDHKKGEIVYHLNLSGIVLRLHATEDRLFALSKQTKHGSLHIYSIDENPAQPELLQHLQFSGSPRDYLFKDNRLFLANGNAGIGMVELHKNSDATFTLTPETPLRSHRLALFGEKLVVFGRTGNIALYSIDADGGLKLSNTTDSCSRVFGADIFGHYAVIATNIEGISIVDLNAPHRLSPANLVVPLPSRLESINWRIISSGISVRDGERLYFLKSMPDGTLKHTGQTTYPASQFFNAHSIYNSRIYAAIKNSGLHVTKISPEGTLQTVKNMELPIRASNTVHAIETHGVNMYLCTSDGLQVYDISNPDHPVYRPEEDISGDIRSIAFGGGFAYISSYGEGIKIARINAENKLGPTATINFPLHLLPVGKSLDIVYEDGFLFAACGYRGLLSIDVRKPHHPVIVDSFELSGYCNHVALNKGIMGATSQDSVYLFDVKNPEHIRMLGKADNVKDFYLGDREILYLQREGVLRTPPPMLLELVQSSGTKLTFQLPSGITKGSYNLFLNLNEKRSQLIGTLINTPSGASGTKWELIQHQAE